MDLKGCAVLDAALLQDIEDALDHAGPEATVAVLRPLLAECLQATGVRLLLVNYQLTALRPIGDPDDREQLRDSASGEAFVMQQPVVRPSFGQAAVMYLPVTARGDRIGVLQLTLPTQPGPSELVGLQRLARVIAYALQAGIRQTDAVARAARSKRLTLAAELQWQLLPGRGVRAPEYELEGHLEPAYHVHADNFDWSQDEDQLVLSVSDAAQHGQGASLLTTLAVTALRNARRAGLELAAQAGLADQAIYAYHQGHQYISTLLIRIDLGTGRVGAVLAGSPRLFVLRGTRVLEPRLIDQSPLGMFEGTDYVEEEFGLATGDRVLMTSNGVHAARSPSKELFGVRGLPELLRATSDQPVGVVARAVIEALFEHQDRAEIDDDAAVICLDWRGPGDAGSVLATRLMAIDAVPGNDGQVPRLSMVPVNSPEPRRASAWGGRE